MANNCAYHTPYTGYRDINSQPAESVFRTRLTASTPPARHRTLACSNMTGTVSPKGDIAMVFITNSEYSTPWPVAKVMKKGGKLR